MTTQEVLSRLRGVKGGRGQWTARCPAHDDTHNSLSVSTGQDGRILLNCHAGCSVESIAGAMGLSVKDLFEDKPQGHEKPQVVAIYNYPGGVQKLRYSDKHFGWRRPDGSGGWIWNRQGVKPSLYIAGELTGAVFVCEGEKDADNLHRVGWNAVSGADGAGAGKWKPEYTEALKGLHVCIFQDNDEVGKSYAQETAAALHGEAAGVKLLDLSQVWPEIPEHGDVSDLFDAFGDDRACGMISRLIAQTPEWEPVLEDVGAFVPIVPFVPPSISRLSTFPIGSLPPALRGMAWAAAENLQVDPGMTAVLGLAVAALCVQGKFIINPKPGWIEQLNLYASVIARPSERKTPALAIMTRPLHAFEKEENKFRAPLIDESRMKREILIKKISNMKELAAKPTPQKGTPVTFDDITELQYELSDLEREAVRPLRLLADDTTPEALISLMAENDGKMGIVSDEGGIFDTIAGKYSGGKANMDVFLKSYTGSYLRVDRKGRTPEVIEHPTLTMLLMVQPAVLEAIMANNEFAGRGLLARFLYALPRSIIGHRKYRTPPIPQDVEQAYDAAIRALLSIPDLGEARVIKLSPEADQEAERFFIELESRLSDDFGDLDDLDGWAAKYHGQIMRIAGIIHCCLYFQDAGNAPVSLDTMRAAQTIGNYFLEHTRAAFHMMGLTEKQEEKDAKYILKRIHISGLYDTTKRQLFQQCDGRIHSIEEMESGLQVLIDRGYIRVQKVKTGGRPTEKIIFNPEAKVQKVQKVQ